MLTYRYGTVLNSDSSDCHVPALREGNDQARKSVANNPICALARIHSVGGSEVNVPGKCWAVAAISRSTALTKTNPRSATQ